MKKPKLSLLAYKMRRMINEQGTFDWHSFRRTDGPVTVGLDGYEFYSKTGDLGPGSVNVFINQNGSICFMGKTSRETKLA